MACPKGQSSASAAQSCKVCPPTGCAAIEATTKTTVAPLPSAPVPHLRPSSSSAAAQSPSPTATTAVEGGAHFGAFYNHKKADRLKKVAADDAAREQKVAGLLSPASTCEPGKFVSKRRAVSAINPFQFDMGLRTVCVACPLGKFSTVATSSCQECPTGMTTPAVASSTCAYERPGDNAATVSAEQATAASPSAAGDGAAAAQHVTYRMLAPGTMAAKAPFLLGGGVANLQETVGGCQRLCAATSGCAVGTYIDSGECWLASQKHVTAPPACPGACQSFVELDPAT